MTHFKSSRRYSRRHFLKSAGASAALLPLLQGTSARAGTGAIPKRFIAISVPNGYTKDYLPNQEGRGWGLDDAQGKVAPEKPLKSLLPHRDRLLVLRGLDLQNGRDSFRDARRKEGMAESELGQLGGHASMPFLLTGARGVPGPRISDGVELSSGHASLDQHLAATLPGYADLAFPTLVLRPLRLKGNDQYLSFGGPCLDGVTPNAPPPRDNPIALYDDLFASQGVDREALRVLRLQRRSVLDLVSGQLTRFRGHVASEDRQRIDQHLDGVRDLERQLEALQRGACMAPGRGRWEADVDYTRQFGNEHIPQIVKAQIDMIVGAMGCDLTRIATLSLSNSHNNQYVFPWLADRDPGFGQGIDLASGEGGAGGSQDGLRHHHSIAHATNIGPDQLRRKNFVDQWFVEQFAYLLDRLTQTMDPDGRPMIENTLVLFMNMQRTGGGHQTDDLAWLLGGNAAGFFDTGRHVHLRSEPTTRLLTSIAHAMGSEQEYFATDEYGGALTALHA